MAQERMKRLFRGYKSKEKNSANIPTVAHHKQTIRPMVHKQKIKPAVSHKHPRHRTVHNKHISHPAKAKTPVHHGHTAHTRISHPVKHHEKMLHPPAHSKNKGHVGKTTTSDHKKRIAHQIRRQAAKKRHEAHWRLMRKRLKKMFDEAREKREKYGG